MRKLTVYLASRMNDAPVIAPEEVADRVKAELPTPLLHQAILKIKIVHCN